MGNNRKISRRLDDQFDLGFLLDAVEAASPVNAVEVFTKELTRLVAADNVSFLIADFSGDALIRFLSAPTDDLSILSDDDHDNLTTVPLTGSPYEQALRSQRVFVQHHEQSTLLFAPVTDRGDAIGVLELSLPLQPSKDVIAFVASAAHTLAYVVIANRRHTDLFERGQRNLPFSLAAEIQRRLLPAAFTCEAAEFTLAGWLEVAGETGGDTFDYSVERNSLHLSITDAKGHTVDAAQIATLAVGSLRNSRRSHAILADRAAIANTALSTHAKDEDFVTGLLLRIDLANGAVTAINAGHPNPYLVRDRVVSEIAMRPDLPMGMFPDTTYTEQDFALEPGDRLVLVTDGMLERNAASLDLTKTLTNMVGLHPREVVHAFSRSVLKANGGILEDDATVLCVDWYGHQTGSGNRITSAGASQSRASRPKR